MARKTRNKGVPAREPRKGGLRPRVQKAPEQKSEQGFLFDPYWDEAFSAYFDPTLRTCCQLRY